MASFERPLFLSPFKLNEPLLDNRLIPLCKKVNRDATNVGLRIFTNGSALTAEKIEGIASLKRILHLWISLNSHIPEEYEKLMGLKFETTAKKLDYLHNCGFPHRVMLSCVGFPNEPFRRYCFERWPNFESVALRKDSWLGFTDTGRDEEVPNGPCYRWFEMSIMANGKVAHCCMDSGEDERWQVGDVNKQTLYEVYNSPRWRERREKLLSRKELDPETSPCSGCTY
jgi:radical SAM protein with 4Fe4S-binding SPASM domain